MATVTGSKRILSVSYNDVTTNNATVDNLLSVRNGVSGSSATDWQKIADLGVLDFYSHTYSGVSHHKFYNGNWTGYYYFNSGSSTGEQSNVRITSSGNVQSSNKIEINDGTAWRRVYHEGDFALGDYLLRSGGTLYGNVTINNSTSFYLDDAGTGTPSRLWRAGGNSTRFEYYDNVFIFDAKDNADFEIRDSADISTFIHSPSNGNTRTYGRFLANNGTAALPAFAFNDDGNTGIYANGSDGLYVSTGGTARAYFNSSGINSVSNVYTANGGSFRNYSGTWAASTGLTGNGFQFINSIDGTAMTISSTGTVQATADFRAPIFYDSNNTAYYSNPEGTSNLNNLTVNGTFLRAIIDSRAVTDTNKLLSIEGNYTNGLYTHRFRKRDIGGGVPMSLDYTQGTAGSYTELVRWGPYSGDGEYRIRHYDNVITYGVHTATTDMRSPLFYDDNNTSYYVDPNGTSNIATLNVATINRNPTVTLSGDVTGSATMTNLGSINITTTVANNSHTHSNYMPIQNSTAYTTIAADGWDYNLGNGVMARADSVNKPTGATHGYWFVTGRRDVGSGYAGIYINSYTSGQHGMWIGRGIDGTVSPTWEKVWTEADFDISDYLLSANYVDDYVNAASFNTGTGVLTLTRAEGGTVTVDLDGRYLTSETDSQTLSWNGGTGELSISNGNTVDLDGRYYNQNGTEGNLFASPPNGTAYYAKVASWEHSGAYSHFMGDFKISQRYGISKFNVETSVSNPATAGFACVIRQNNLVNDTLTTNGDVRILADYSGSTTLVELWVKVDGWSGNNYATLEDYHFHSSVGNFVWSGNDASTSSTAPTGVSATYTNSSPFYANESIRAPIFYDLDNTGYYVNPSATSRVSKIEFVDANTRIEEGGSNSLRIQTGTGYGDLGSMNTSWFHLRTDRAGFYTNKKLHVDGDIFVYGTQSQLTSSSVRAPIFYDSNNTAFYVNPASQSVVNTLTVSNIQAPLYTDSDNSSYYVDPNGTSNIWAFNANRFCTIATSAGGHLLTVRKVGAGYADGNACFNAVLDNATGSASWAFHARAGGTTASETFKVRADGYTYLPRLYDINNTAYYLDPASTSILKTVSMDAAVVTTSMQIAVDVTANGSVRAPIFYDSDNTAYYTNQASTSNYNILNVGTINRDPTVTLSGDVTGSATMTNLGSINIVTTVANDSHTHDTRYVLKTGDTMTGKLVLSDTGYSLGNYKHEWQTSYTLNITTPKELLYSDGNSLPAGGVYRFSAHIDGTGTDNWATAVYWNQNGTWKLNVTQQSGVNSNHPEFIISNGVPTLAIDHSTNYTVRVFSERLELNEGIGTDNNAGFGADSFLGSVGGVLRYNPDGSATSYAYGYPVFHDNYHPNADTWTTARTNTVTLTGDVTGTGSASVNGSGNWTVSISTAVANDSHSHSNYVLKTGDTMTGTLNANAAQGITLGTASSRSKLSVYNGGPYQIGMQSGVTYGGLNDWAMTFQFNNETDRGFWWGHDGHTTAQGAMSLTTAGHLFVGSRVDAPIFYDSNNTGYYLNAAGTSRFNQIDSNYCDVAANNAYAVRFWNGSHNYSIRMSQSTNTTYGGRVSGETTSDYNMYFTMGGGTNRGFVFRNANAATGVIAGIDSSGNARFEGDVVAYSASDKRLKENIKPIDSALDKVSKLGGYEFDWNDKQTVWEDGKHDVGVIAQEVLEVMPEAVKVRSDSYLGVDYEKLVPLLIQAVKELQAEVKSLKEK